MKNLRYTAASVLLLILSAGAASAVTRVAPEDLPLCDELLPAVLRIAVPSRVASPSNLGAVRDDVKKTFEPYLRSHTGSPLAGSSECRGARRVQINISIGSDYEILDWLSEGEVDGALAAPLTLWLLEGDGARVLDIEQPATSAENPRGRFAVGQRLGSSTTQYWEPEPDPVGFLEAYRQHLFCQAVKSCETAPTLAPAQLRICEDSLLDADAVRVRPVMPHHLSTRGFVLPMSSNSIWLERRIQLLQTRVAEGADTRDLLPEIRNAFWSGWMEDLRLTLDHDPFERMAPQGEAGSSLPSAARSLDIPCCSPHWKEDRRPVVEILFSGVPDNGLGQNQASLDPDPYGTNIFSDGGASVIVQDRWVLLHGALGDGTQGSRRTRRPRVPVVRIPTAFKTVLEPTAVSDKGTTETLPPPRALAGLLNVNSRFGIRSMAFTPDEALRLIHAQTAAREGPFSPLALILPGGGVKSAYQAVLLDRLYGSGSLRNFLVEDPPDLGQRPLEVHQVIGTSGGALTGFFVAQLGSRGPWSLTELLWHRGLKADDPPLAQGQMSPPLRSKDVFSFTDLLRYLSVVVNFSVFCILLVFVVYRERLMGHRRDRGSPAGRSRVTLLLWGVLLAAPLILQMASASGYREHVPEVEGAAYLVLVVLVMAADQCIVSRLEKATDRFQIHWAVLAIPGLVLVLLPVGLQVFLLSQKGSKDWRPTPAMEDLSDFLAGTSANAGLVFLLLTMVAILGGLAIPIRRLQSSSDKTFRYIAWAALDVSLCSFLALILFSSQGLRDRVSWRPELLISVLGVLALAPLLFLLLRRVMKGGGRRRWVTYYLSLFAASATILYLCLPESPGSHETVTALLLAPSGLDVFGGHLMVMIGLPLLTVGLLLVLLEGRNRYRLESVPRFLRGLLLLLVHAVAVLVVMVVLDWLMTKLSDRFVLPITSLELDWRYWLQSVALAAMFGLVLLGLRQRSRWQPVAQLLRGPRGPADGSLSRFQDFLRKTRWRIAFGFANIIRVLRHSALFLLESHPNRPLISIRAFRMLLFGAGAVLWWNLLLAPAAYGNKRAEATLHKTIARFESAYEEVHGAGPSDPRRPFERADVLRPRFRAHFVSPANELKEDGTRFFLFSPQEAEECPEVPQRSRSGSQWFPYQVSHGSDDQRSALGSPSQPCTLFDASTPKGRKFLSNVIFASGSPFPIFAPHRVLEPGSENEEDAMILVDGGYSNNVPVEAALELGARQVLILRSSYPSQGGEEDPEDGFLLQRLGPLARNLLRIPSFLFERSQQVDRLSSQDVFVVSLAPLPSHENWPALFHFQKEVVEDLERFASEDLQKRIGFVESWGRPEARLSFPLWE